CASRTCVTLPLLIRRSDRLASDSGAQRNLAAHTERLPRRADAWVVPVTERALHDAILARVVGYDGDDAVRLQAVAQRRQSSLEPVELAVDGDSNRLEESCEVGRAGASAERAPNGGHQVVAGLERGPGAAPDDLPRQTTRTRL